MSFVVVFFYTCDGKPLCSSCFILKCVYSVVSVLSPTSFVYFLDVFVLTCAPLTPVYESSSSPFVFVASLFSVPVCVMRFLFSPWCSVGFRSVVIVCSHCPHFEPTAP